MSDEHNIISLHFFYGRIYSEKELKDLTSVLRSTPESLLNNEFVKDFSLNASVYVDTVVKSTQGAEIAEKFKEFPEHYEFNCEILIRRELKKGIVIQPDLDIQIGNISADMHSVLTVPFGLDWRYTVSPIDIPTDRPYRSQLPKEYGVRAEWRELMFKKTVLIQPYFPR